MKTYQALRVRGTGRLTPTDWSHVEKYPLLAEHIDALPGPQEVELGIYWYSDFDHPVKKDGLWWIGLNPDKLGFVRGGHAICCKPDSVGDTTGWWLFYNQLLTSMCVGFAGSRCMSLVNRARFDAEWLYYAAQDRAGQPRDPDAGTYVDAAMQVLAKVGHKTPKQASPSLANGISGYRWATNADAVKAVLRSPAQEARGAVSLLNSWGAGYPHVVHMPYETLEVVLAQEGEAAVITDR